MAGSAQALPHADAIQQSFGSHDVGGIRAHVGGDAAQAADELGADAFATGNDVAFRAVPDLHLAAHEAAHVVQQRGGVELKGGLGPADQAAEAHADAVADQVVAGKSAQDLLDAAPRLTTIALRGAGKGNADQPNQDEQVCWPSESLDDSSFVSYPDSDTNAAVVIGSPTEKVASTLPKAEAGTESESIDVRGDSANEITETRHVDSLEILHAEEIFRDVPANTTEKKHAFNRLKKAFEKERRASKAVTSAKNEAAKGLRMSKSIEAGSAECAAGST